MRPEPPDFPGRCDRRRRSIVALLFLAAPACQSRAGGEVLQATRSALATPMFVQVAASVPQIPRTFVPVTYTEAQTAGNLNVVIVGWNDTTASVTLVIDESGNNYLLAGGPTRSADGVSQSIYDARNIAAASAGSNAVSVQLN